MVQQGGLGRGLSSLIPQKKSTVQKKETDNKDTKSKERLNYFGNDVDVKVEEKGGLKKDSTLENKPLGDIALKSIMEVPLDQIVPNPHQPRTNFNEERLNELAGSIKEHGILQPLVVSQAGKEGYELIAGERRLEASKIAGLEKVPVILKKVDDQKKVELALVENIQRDNLNPIEEARAYKKMQDTFALTQEEIANQVSKSRSAVANSLRLLSLPVEIQRALAEGKITEGHARTILAISNPEKQRALFEMIIKENLSVRQVEDKVREVTVGTHKRRIKNLDPETQRQQEELSQFLGTKVRIKKSKKGGQIVIEFYTDDDFNALITRLAPDNKDIDNGK